MIQKGKSLNRDRTKMSNAIFDWEIPKGETNGKLSRIDLRVGSRKFQGIMDSGAETTVQRKSVIQEYLLSINENNLRPEIGPFVEAKRTNIPVGR
ncbi:hypothetical protein CEXT_159281 [Caerostris extrusa]|uniref:Retropepsins domain-containing protein n=1 Tax=Caerostris extrusa TaxID=172846 RepID=A0AAV4SH99_CAEEX|nr:hypothetical protein CEXT_159281 [Caerostris extrusa]